MLSATHFHVTLESSAAEVRINLPLDADGRWTSGVNPLGVLRDQQGLKPFVLRKLGECDPGVEADELGRIDLSAEPINKGALFRSSLPGLFYGVTKLERLAPAGARVCRVTLLLVGEDPAVDEHHLMLECVLDDAGKLVRKQTGFGWEGKPGSSEAFWPFAFNLKDGIDFGVITGAVHCRFSSLDIPGGLLTVGARIVTEADGERWAYRVTAVTPISAG